MTKPAPVLTVLCFSLLCIPSLAQESIGFSDSTDFQYIIDYRLPDWGYSNFYLSTGRFRTTNDYTTNFREHTETEPDATVQIRNENIIMLKLQSTRRTNITGSLNRKYFHLPPICI